MKPQNSTNIVGVAVKLPPSITTYLQCNSDEFEGDNVINGGVLSDFRFAWLSSGSKFIVVNLKTGHKISAWTFGAVLRDFRTKVTCVTEIPSLTDQTKQLLIGLECEMIGGMVCLFHCQGSRVLRAIRLDCKVSCVQYVESFPHGPLQCFDGTVLVGTQGGNALAFDLNRQTCIKAIIHGSNGKEDLIKDELNIANLFTLSIDDISLIGQQRDIACEKDDHIAVQINEGCFHNLMFILHNPNNTVKLRATREKVFVTKLLYIPQLTSVVIGFNFGAFQLWNLVTLELEYTSLTNADGLPITHFGFMEPCDDPRAFSYLWVVFSSLDRHEEGFPLAAMYALTYEGKTSLSGRGFLYQNFIACTLRFNLELSSIDSSNMSVKQMIGGRSLACHPLTRVIGRSEDYECVLNLCQIVWECWTVSAIAPVQSMMILFDIDQWYKEQMPDCTVLETNSYLSVVNLGDTLSHTASSYLCDVKINTNTLTPYYALPKLEEHFYPNSLGYECYCLTNSELTQLSTVGVQRQVLSSINEVGPSVLLHPTNIFQQCVVCGLVPIFMEPTPTLNTSVAIQRETLLSIALEARLIPFLVLCAQTWSTGSHSSVGCSLSTLTRWAWGRALCLKAAGDRLSVPLFDHSGEAPDGNTEQCLKACTLQLGLVAKLLGIILDKCSTYMMPEAIKEVRQQQKAVQVVSLYFQVMQWFLNVGLLPEFSMDSQLHVLDRGVERLPYPAESLVRYYQNRRFKLHCLNGDNPAKGSLEDKSCPLLFIDQFIKMECAEEKMKKFWIDDGSETKGLYPPPSLHSLLRIYLIPEIKEEHKHSLVLYVLVDYATTFDDSRYESAIRRLMQFPTMFGLSNNAIKVTEAFWHLDHRDFEFALEQLQCVLAGGCLKQWQHNVVLSSLLAQKKTQSALQYLHVRKPYSNIASNDSGERSLVYDDWEACCNLYLSRGLVLEAFNLIKETLKDVYSADIREQRLIVFLEGCRKVGLLSKTLLLPLSQDQEDILTNFLKALGDLDAHNLLVMYYLQRSRYMEAQHVNDDLKRLSTKGQLPYDVSSDFSMKKDHIPKTKTRDELVDMYCKTLPKVTRNLALIASGNILTKKMSMPTPMTVNLQAVTPKLATYRSSIIQATINKANETWMEKPSVARKLKRALHVEETPFICTPKMARHTSRLSQVEKMNTTPDDCPESISAKRARLEDSECEGKEEEDEEAQDPKVREEVEALLHTPIVERRSRWRCASRTSGRSTPDRISVREATPQSILKVRKLLDGGSSIDERHYAETDDELETASLNTQSDNLSRSIRFNIPSTGNTPSPSISPSELDDNLEELSGIKPFSQTSFKALGTQMSPRKGIHDSYKDEEGEVSMTTTATTPVKRTPPRGRKLLSETHSPPASLKDFASEDNLHTVIHTPTAGDIDDSLEYIDCGESKDKTIVNENIDLHTKSINNLEVDLKNSSVAREGSIDNKDDNLFDEPVEFVEKSPSHIASFNTSNIKGPQPRRSLRNTPVKSFTSPDVSPRRSLRSHNRTTEAVGNDQNKISPARSTPGQSKIRKSLARRVLEANALSVTTEILSADTFSKSQNNSKNETTLQAEHSNVVRELSETVTSKYTSLVTSKHIASLSFLNDVNTSLLESDKSDIASDTSLEITSNNDVPKHVSLHEDLYTKQDLVQNTDKTELKENVECSIEDNDTHETKDAIAEYIEGGAHTSIQIESINRETSQIETKSIAETDSNITTKIYHSPLTNNYLQSLRSGTSHIATLSFLNDVNTSLLKSDQSDIASDTSLEITSNNDVPKHVSLHEDLYTKQYLVQNTDKTELKENVECSIEDHDIHETNDANTECIEDGAHTSIQIESIQIETKSIAETESNITTKLHHSPLTNSYLQSLRSGITLNESLLVSDISEIESESSFVEPISGINVSPANNIELSASNKENISEVQNTDKAEVKQIEIETDEKIKETFIPKIEQSDEESNSGHLVIDSEQDKNNSEDELAVNDPVPSDIGSDSNEKSDTGKSNIGDEEHIDDISGQSGKVSDDENPIDVSDKDSQNDDKSDSEESSVELKEDDESSEKDILHSESESNSIENRRLTDDEVIMGNNETDYEDTENDKSESDDSRNDSEEDESDNESSDNMYFEESSEDVANKAILGDGSDVICIDSSDDSQSNTIIVPPQELFISDEPPSNSNISASIKPTNLVEPIVSHENLVLESASQSDDTKTTPREENIHVLDVKDKTIHSEEGNVGDIDPLAENSSALTERTVAIEESVQALEDRNVVTVHIEEQKIDKTEPLAESIPVKHNKLKSIATQDSEVALKETNIVGLIAEKQKTDEIALVVENPNMVIEKHDEVKGIVIENIDQKVDDKNIVTPSDEQKTDKIVSSAENPEKHGEAKADENVENVSICVEEQKMENVDALTENTQKTQCIDINNMSLMTEEGSTFDDPISLHLSEDECEQPISKIPEVAIDSCVQKQSENIVGDKCPVAIGSETVDITNISQEKNVSTFTAKCEIENKNETLKINVTTTKDDTVVPSENIQKESVYEPIQSDESVTQNQESKLTAEISTPKKTTRSSSRSDNSPKSLRKTISTESSPRSEDLDTSIAMSTRSASKRKSTSKDESQATLKSKSTKKNSKDEDDNASVVSNASSRRSRRSESKMDTSFCSDDLPTDEVESSSAVSRKCRRSMFVAKPNLSVIPEVSSIETSQLEKTDISKEKDSTIQDLSIIEQFSASRRLTRHQKSLLERSLENAAEKSLRSIRPVNLQAAEETIYEDAESDVSEQNSESSHPLRTNLTGKVMDPMELLNKEDFKGEPDPEEMRQMETSSISSVTSDFTRSIPDRTKRASSEVPGPVVKEIRKTRRASLDIAPSPVKLSTPVKALGTPIGGLDDSLMDSGGRPRRRSFNKAIEALSTPRRKRRTSTDSKNDNDGASDTSITERITTPNILRESRLGDVSHSKLIAIEENEDEIKETTSAIKPKKKGRKAVSEQGYMSPDMERIDKPRKMSQLLTPLSKEELISLEGTKRLNYRRRTTIHKVVQPIEFVIKKK